MKISLNWINEFVEIKDLDPKEIALTLTMKTAETEGVYIKSEHYSGIMTALIESAEKYDDKHFICRVKADREYSVVSGAPNTRAGMMTLFVKPGGMIEGAEVSEREVAGKVSQGMLLSGKEAGINNDHSGLFELTGEYAPGTDIGEISDYYDSIIEIDNKSLTHRPDLWGMYGFARELAAIYGRELKKYEVMDASELKSGKKIPVEIADKELCYRYVGVRVDNIKIAQSPLNIQIRLFHTDHTPRNLIVDLTNYLLAELGQPMHAFDGDKIEGIKVDTLKKETLYKTLDGAERKLPAGTLMINSTKESVAIAGIMGGGNSEINSESKSLFLESASFNADNIRKESTKIQLRTDASSRFEKSLDPENAMTAALRYLHLLKTNMKDAELSYGISDVNNNPFGKNRVKTSYSFIRKIMGALVSDDEIKRILTSLYFEVEEDGDSITVIAPTFRSTKDISIPEDIVEEVARIYGYDNIIPLVPSQKMIVPDFDSTGEREDKIRDMLAYNYGMSETDSHPWFDNKFNKKISFTDEDLVTVRNPITNDNTYLRSSMLPIMLKFVYENLKYTDSFGLFEFAHIFRGKNENKVLSLIIVDKKSKKGDEKLFMKMKEIISGVYLRANGNSFVLKDAQPNRLINPSVSADIYLQGSRAGYIGAVHPQFNTLLDKKVNIVYAEMDTFSFRESGKEIKYAPIPVFQQSFLDFSVLKPDREHFDTFNGRILAYRDTMIKSYEITAIYTGENIEAGFSSVTYRFILGFDDRTITNEDMTAFKEKFIEHIEKQGYKLR